MNPILTYLRRSAAPLTTAIVAVLAVVSVVFFFSAGKGMELLIADAEWTRKPWTLLLYPFAYSGVGDISALLFALCMIGWVLYACGSIEREIGPAKYIIVWAVLTALPALLIQETMRLMHSGYPLMGPYLPISGLTVAWATRNQHARFLIWGLIPVTGRIIGWITLAGTFFSFGLVSPLVGLASIVSLVLAWTFASNRIPFFKFKSLEIERVEKKQAERELAFRAEVVVREREREERERLRRLFERSVIDEK